MGYSHNWQKKIKIIKKEHPEKVAWHITLQMTLLEQLLMAGRSRLKCNISIPLDRELHAIRLNPYAIGSYP